MRVSSIKVFAAASWLVYPLLLFVLPNGPSVGSFAPETLFALLCGVWVGLVMLFCMPARTLYEAMRELPGSVVIFCMLVIALMLFKGGPIAALRACSWCVVLVLSYFAFRDARAFRHLLWLWFSVAVLASLAVIARHGIPMPPRIDFLSWQHRTVFGYFLALAIPAGIVLLQSRRGGNLFLTAGLCVISLALLATMSRGPWLLACLTLAVLDTRTRRWAAVAGIVFAAGAVVMLPDGLLIDLSDRFRSLYDWDIGSSSLYRYNLYTAAWTSLPHSWLGGAPTTQFGPFLAQFAPVRYPAFYNPAFNADSDLIYVVLLGGVPLFAVMLWMMWSLWQRIVAAGSDAVEMVGMRRALLAGLIVQMTLDSIIWTALGWFLIGAVLAPPRAAAA